MTGAGQRVRDPDRRAKILDATARLVAGDGYHKASMADIGRAAGITGSGIYRHFANKSEILVVLFDGIIDQLLADARSAVETCPDLRQLLDQLVLGQIEFVVGKRELAMVYHGQIHNLPDDDQQRLRRKQRMYVQEWVHALRELRPELDETTVRTVVHAAIAAIQSPLLHHYAQDAGMADRLRSIAAAVLATGSSTPVLPELHRA